MASNPRAIDGLMRSASDDYVVRFDTAGERGIVEYDAIQYGVIQFGGIKDSYIDGYQLGAVITSAAPVGTDRALTTPSRYTLRLPDFGFSDTDGHSFASVRIASLATSGTLFYDANGSNGGQRTAVTVGQSITRADILADRLTFVSSGTSPAAFTFQVRDSNNELDASANTLTFNPVASNVVNTLFGTSINLAGLAIGDGFRLSGPAASSTGIVGTGGDFNGDGFADIIIGASRDSAAGEYAGAAYVVFGRATGFGAVDLTTLNGTNGFRLLGEAADDEAGVSVSSAGDINGDGFDEILVGSRGNDVGFNGAGATYVVFGRASGFAASLSLANLTTGGNGFRINGEGLTSQAGISVSSAGDVNGDGFADIIIGSNFNGAGRPGAAYVVFGKATGFGDINLTAVAAGTGGFRISGQANSDYLGRSVSAADVNGDGFSDLIVSAYGNSNASRAENGAVYVIFGSATITAAPVLSALNGSNGFVINGALRYDYAGHSVSSAGDFNGDGFADILIGQRDIYSGSGNTGAAYVVFGRASGTFPASVDLNGITAANGFQIGGESAGDFAGITVSAAGDVNGDGFADILVGATGNDGAANNAGAAYLIFGRASGFGPISLAALGTAGVEINGEGANGNAAQVSAAGDVNGDGFADILIGATGTNAAYVIFGRSNISNSAPTLNANTGSTVAEGGTDTVSSTELDFNDAQQADAAITYTLTSAATNGTLRLSGNALAVNGTFTQADINNNLITYLHNGGETTSASFGFSVSDGAGGSVTGQTFTFTVTAVDDAPVAVADPTNAVNENATVAINVRANDTDVDAGPINVASINGSAATVGNAITLASGATATLNADGTISYNPNAQFNYLVSAATAATTGASNGSATDSFTYALNGASSATVTVTINGVDGAGSELRGGAGANTLTGTSSNDLFNLGQGGNDTASGGGGDDGFYFGGAFDGNDNVDGGPGTLDQVALQGNYGAGVTLGANSAVGIEQFVLLPGSDTRFGVTGNPTLSYNITTGNAAIAAGQQLVFQANTLRAGESFTLDASGELDGSVFTYAGAGADNLRGSQNADAFFFGTGRFNAGDIVDGQGGSDQMALQGTYAGANAITFGAGQLLNLEMIVCLSNNDTRFGGAGSGTPYSYTLTMNDGNVASGARLVIQANALANDEVLTFNGAAETNGNYSVFGGAGADTITGGALADTISGRGGVDNLTGGGGSDIFLYSNLTDSITTAQDRILDFTTGDVINLSAIDAITGGGNDAFAFIGSGAFSNSAGQLRAVNTSGNNWLIEADVNGDNVADLSILVTVADAHVLGPGDFVL